MIAVVPLTPNGEKQPFRVEWGPYDDYTSVQFDGPYAKVLTLSPAQRSTKSVVFDDLPDPGRPMSFTLTHSGGTRTINNIDYPVFSNPAVSAPAGIYVGMLDVSHPHWHPSKHSHEHYHTAYYTSHNPHLI